MLHKNNLDRLLILGDNFFSMIVKKWEKQVNFRGQFMKN